MKLRCQLSNPQFLETWGVPCPQAMTGAPLLPREGHTTGGHHWVPPEGLAEEAAESRDGSPAGGHKW